MAAVMISAIERECVCIVLEPGVSLPIFEFHFLTSVCNCSTGSGNLKGYNVCLLCKIHFFSSGGSDGQV